MPAITAYSGRTMNGSRIWLMPMTTPRLVRIRRTSSNPKNPSAVCTGPLSCKRITHAKVRTIRLVQNGTRTSIVSTARTFGPNATMA